MSRSFCKKHKFLKNYKGMKRKANKKVRQTFEIGNGKNYRKVFNTWDINDGYSSSKPIFYGIQTNDNEEKELIISRLKRK